jgi:hypothetical protein
MSLLKTANRLIALGNDGAYQSLRKYSDGFDANDVGDHSNYVTWLCLLLYKGKTTDSLSLPCFGSPDFPYPINHAQWPIFPLVFIGKTPFLLVSGYNLNGFAFPGSYYVKEYHKNGMFRTKPYPIPSQVEVQSDLDNFLKSKQWKSLSWTNPEFEVGDKVTFLKNQIKLIAKH